MIDYKEHAPWLKPIFQIILIAAVVAGLYYLRNIVLYFLLAALITLIGRPVFRFFHAIRIRRRIGIPGNLAAIFTLLTLLTGIGLLMWALAPLIIEQAKGLMSMNPEALVVALEEPIDALAKKLDSMGMDATQVTSEAKETLQKTASRFLESDLLVGFTGLVGNLSNFIMGFFAVLFMSFFFLMQPGTLHRVFLTIVPNSQNAKMTSAIEDVKHLLRRYILGLLAQVVLVGGLLSLGLWIVGYPNALLIGLLGGLVNLIPYLGPLIGAGMGMLFYLTTHMDMPFYAELLPMLGLIALVFLTVQLLDNFFMQPYLFATSVKAHPIEIFVVILIGGQIGGVLGMLMAIPVYTTIRVLARTFYPQNRFVQALMPSAGDEPPPEGGASGGPSSQITHTQEF